MTQLTNIANKFGLNYSPIPCGKSFDGEDVTMHFFSVFGKDATGGWSNPSFVLIETGAYFTILNGLDSVYNQNEAAGKVRQWAELMDIVEVECE